MNVFWRCVKGASDDFNVWLDPLSYSFQFTQNKCLSMPTVHTLSWQPSSVPQNIKDREAKWSAYMCESVPFFENLMEWDYIVTLNSLLHRSIVLKLFHLQAYLRNIVGSVLDHRNRANIAIKRVTQLLFWFPRAYKNYAHTILYFIIILYQASLPAGVGEEKPGSNPS